MKKQIQFVVLSAVALVSSVAVADLKDAYFQRYLNRLEKQQQKQHSLMTRMMELLTLADPAALPASPGTPTIATFDQLLNYADPNDTRTFQQRYFVNSDYASGPDAPVFFYVCGEAACDGWPSLIATYAQQFKGHLVALEHRYYGKSYPFPSFTTENLKYLSTDYALRDLDRFEQYARATLGLTGKWISIGGSYPGSLSAYYREKYPQNVVGALASSAPVHAQENFEQYDLHVATVAGPDCAVLMRKVVKQAQDAYQSGDTAGFNAIKTEFAASDVADPLDFLYLMADVGATAIQYGGHDEFCQLLQQSDPMLGYAQYAKEVYTMWNVNAVQFSNQGATDLDASSYENDIGSRAWFYQSCMEYGYWQNAYHDPAISVRSPLINPAYHRQLCNRLFGIQVGVDTDVINTSLYQPLLSPTTASAILFTDGSEDPWALLSITATNGNAVNPATPAVMIDQHAHCDDLGSPKDGDNDSLKGARAEFVDLVTGWLK